LKQDFYIENVYEELDQPREFYFNHSTGVLSYIPEQSATAADPSTWDVVVPVLEELLRVGGTEEHADQAADAKAAPSPAQHVSFRGLTFRHTTPTFMAPAGYESGQGGDWAYYRSGAVVLSNAEDVTVEECALIDVEGNAIAILDHVYGSTIQGNECAGAGDSCVLMVGSTNLMDGTANTQPTGNAIVHNHFHHFGVWGKQTAGVFHGVSRNNNISFNVIHDCPRPGININGACTSRAVHRILPPPPPTPTPHPPFPSDLVCVASLLL
jgi:hypothetical protein